MAKAARSVLNSNSSARLDSSRADATPSSPVMAGPPFCRWKCLPDTWTWTEKFVISQPTWRTVGKSRRKPKRLNGLVWCRLEPGKKRHNGIQHPLVGALKEIHFTTGNSLAMLPALPGLVGRCPAQAGMDPWHKTAFRSNSAGVDALQVFKGWGFRWCRSWPPQLTFAEAGYAGTASSATSTFDDQVVP